MTFLGLRNLLNFEENTKTLPWLGWDVLSQAETPISNELWSHRWPLPAENLQSAETAQKLRSLQSCTERQILVRRQSERLDSKSLLPASAERPVGSCGGSATGSKWPWVKRNVPGHANAMRNSTKTDEHHPAKKKNST